MSSAFLETIQLENGDFALKGADETSDPLVSITFSDEAKAYIDDAAMEVAKAMIQAGIQVVARLDEARFKGSTMTTEEEEGTTKGVRILH